MKVYPPRDIRPFVMYCVNGKPRSSLLIESTDSMNRDITLRNLIKKGPSYREQNNIDWKMNEKTSKKAVSGYYQKWAKAACVDKRVLRDWKEAMYNCIDERIKILQQLHINKRKKQVLKSKVHLDYLNKIAR